MTKLLEEAIAQARTLPEAEQDELAKLLMEAVEDGDRKWDELFARPESQTLLEKLWRNAEEEIARGEVYEIDCRPPRR